MTIAGTESVGNLVGPRCPGHSGSATNSSSTLGIAADRSSRAGRTRPAPRSRGSAVGAANRRRGRARTDAQGTRRRGRGRSARKGPRAWWSRGDGRTAGAVAAMRLAAMGRCAYPPFCVQRRAADPDDEGMHMPSLAIAMVTLLGTLAAQAPDATLQTSPERARQLPPAAVADLDTVAVDTADPSTLWAAGPDLEGVLRRGRHPVCAVLRRDRAAQLPGPTGPRHGARRRQAAHPPKRKRRCTSGTRCSSPGQPSPNATC
jgi:hypothetical protein